MTLWVWLALVAALVAPAIARAASLRRFHDPLIDSLIKPPTDLGFGKHDQAQEREARKRRDEARALALDAARARLPRRLVFLDDRARFGGRR